MGDECVSVCVGRGGCSAASDVISQTQSSMWADHSVFLLRLDKERGAH